MVNQEYISLCEYAVTRAEKSGADECEAMMMCTCSTSVAAESGELSTISSIEQEGLRIRIIKDKAIGSVFTYKTDRASLRELIEKAVKAVHSSWKDEFWSSLPFPGNYTRVKVWDKTIQDLTPGELIEPVVTMIEHISPPTVVHRIAHEVNTRSRTCVNSNGICHSDCGTQENFMLRAVRKECTHTVTPTCYLASYQRKYDPPYYLIEELETLLSLFTQKKKAVSEKTTVILSPLVILKLFHYTLLGALSGESVTRGTSYCAQKEGESIASSLLSLHDNGIVETGTASQEMDAEGVPSQDTPLIQDGVLQGFIWDTYWAKRMHRQSTGNAFYNYRTGRMGIRHTNLVIEGGTHGWEELLDGVNGYYIYDIGGAHSANANTGTFTVNASPAFQIRDGHITGGITRMMLSDTIFSLIKKITAIGKELQVRQDALFPPIRCENVQVIAP